MSNPVFLIYTKFCIVQKKSYITLFMLIKNSPASLGLHSLFIDFV